MSGEGGQGDRHVDRYELQVKPGMYRILVPAIPDYRLANFRVAPGETFSLYLPQFRFAVSEVCKNDELFLKTYSSETSLEEQEKIYSSLPFHGLRTDVLSVNPPFETVLRFCGKYGGKGDITYYRAVSVYYKNYYILADEVQIDRNKRTLKAIGKKAEMFSIEKDGREIATEGLEFTISLDDVL